MVPNLKCQTLPLSFQTYFAETTYYKSMLESKNKVYQKIKRSGTKVLNIEPMDQAMTEFNQRFQVRKNNVI